MSNAKATIFNQLNYKLLTINVYFIDNFEIKNVLKQHKKVSPRP